MEKPVVSIIIPVRNEEKNIKACLESLIKTDYPRDNLEIILIDGMSDDNTPRIIDSFISQNREFNITNFKNSKIKKTPGLNIGIKKANGEIIIIADAHSIYCENYIDKCVNVLKNSNAENVGGRVIVVPGKNTNKAKGIALSLSSVIGTGGAFYRREIREPIEADTVPFGCFRRSLIDKIGYFNEKLERTEDIEFNKRIRESGGKIKIFPEIVIWYIARTKYLDLWKNNFSNGYGIIYETKYSDISFSLRHLIPFLFIISVVILGVLSFISFFKIFFLMLITVYGLSIIGSSIYHTIKEKDMYIFPYILVSFVVLHFSYGLGSLFASIKILFEKGDTK